MTASTTSFAAVLAVAGVLSGCSAAPGEPDLATEVAAQQTAEKLLQLTEVHEETGMALLEGPTFGPDGDLYVVDVTAPSGAPKVQRVDVETQKVSTVFTDDSSAFTSAQFSPLDGRLYLTDIAGGKITSITSEGKDPVTFFSGEVDGVRLNPDDIAFNAAGDLYVSDFTAMPGAPLESASAGGRVVRIDHDTAAATVIADKLPSPNGISFTNDFTGLWLSQYSANRIDLLTLGSDGTSVASLHPGMYVDGGAARVDSNAVDADGNVYQAFEGQPRIDVYNPQGRLVSSVGMPDGGAGLESATNLAIEPGTRNGYITVSGPDGGFIYSFTAEGDGIRQSNGG
ncbi:SMP-30/gluconolactonase/LRE family protein [Specibacter sp. AOP5-B1-6]